MTIPKWAWRAPITGNNGYHTEQFYRWLELFQNEVGGDITISPGPGIGVSGSPVAPGGTVIITNTGVTSLTQTQPAAGLTITNSGSTQTLAVSNTFALANDLAAVEGLVTYGFTVRTDDDTWETRVLEGITNRTTVTNGDGVAGNATIDISSSYVGQSSITTLGTVTTGVWNGTAIPVGFGGTGLTSTPTNGQLDIGNGTGFTRATLTAGTGVSITNGAGSITINATGSGGTVTNVSVVSANGFAGSVATSTTTPAITLTTSVTGILSGNGTAISAASTTGSGSVVLATAPTLSGQLTLGTAGAGLSITEGTNCKQGVATLVAGTVTVNNTSVTANSRIFLTPQEGGLFTGSLRVSARTASTSFTILSTVLTDTCDVAYFITEPT